MQRKFKNNFSNYKCNDKQQHFNLKHHCNEWKRQYKFCGYDCNKKGQANVQLATNYVIHVANRITLAECI